MIRWHMRRIRFALISVFAVAIGLLWLMAPPPWDRSVSLSFVGYTNGPSGERLVSLVLSNNSHATIRRFPVCELVSEQQKLVSQTPFPAGFLYVEPGQAAAFSVARPREQPPWRAMLLLSPEGVRSKIDNWISQSPWIRSRVPMKWRGVPSKHIYSDWVRE